MKDVLTKEEAEQAVVEHRGQLLLGSHESLRAQLTAMAAERDDLCTKLAKAETDRSDTLDHEADTSERCARLEMDKGALRTTRDDLIRRAENAESRAATAEKALGDLTTKHEALTAERDAQRNRVLLCRFGYVPSGERCCVCSDFHCAGRELVTMRYERAAAEKALGKAGRDRHLFAEDLWQAWKAFDEEGPDAAKTFLRDACIVNGIMNEDGGRIALAFHSDAARGGATALLSGDIGGGECGEWNKDNLGTVYCEKCKEYIVGICFEVVTAKRMLRDRVAQLDEEKRLVQSWLRNMPDAADLEVARKEAERVADQIAVLNTAHPPHPVQAAARRAAIEEVPLLDALRWGIMGYFVKRNDDDASKWNILRLWKQVGVLDSPHPFVLKVNPMRLRATVNSLADAEAWIRNRIAEKQADALRGLLEGKGGER